MGARRIARRWLLAAVGLAVCLCVFATSIRASHCRRAAAKLAAAAMATPRAGGAHAGEHASASAVAPERLAAAPSPGDAPLAPPAHAAPEASCAGALLAPPVPARVAARFLEHARAPWRVADAHPRAVASGIDRPPRRA